MNEVVAYIDNLNAEGAAWVAEDPDNRFRGELVNDPAHWEGYGITTVSGLLEYFDACAAKEARKASYYEDDCAAEDRAVREFEITVAKCIENGAADRETAIRWIKESYGEFDYGDEELEYTMGVPFGFFAKEAAA